MKKLKKLFFVVLGSFIMGFGISLTIAVNLGSDPMTLFWIGIANQLHITVGQANLLVCAVLLFIVFFFDRHQIHVGSIINPIAIAIVTDWLAFMDLQSLSYGVRIILMILGFMILAFGAALYAIADYGRGAYEAVVFTVCEKGHIAVGIVRTSCDIILAILGILLGATAAIGTILAILCIGSGIQFFVKMLTTGPMHKIITTEN
ncbi:YczE/YyaS/YitT family protein [Merdibacter massiliensis]|uniref:YczE/YyaS/YitT family protein n=1 Tax=Merdibacter massiliensis TaxID=1871030 RepID=UPI00096A4676|nr:hypothetical protein [Merdibacter massiliensis]